MITSVNEFKKQYNKGNSITETVTPAICPDPLKMDFILKIERICKSIHVIGLPADKSLKILTEIYTDASKAPEDINVKFVKENLNLLKEHYAKFPAENNVYDFTTEMLDNNTPSECIMHIKDHVKIKQLTEALNTQIKKDNFKAIYENDIFFINDLDKMNEKNKNIVFMILKEIKAKNISTQLKWTRIVL